MAAMTPHQLRFQDVFEVRLYDKESLVTWYLPEESQDDFVDEPSVSEELIMAPFTPHKICPTIPCSILKMPTRGRDNHNAPTAAMTPRQLHFQDTDFEVLPPADESQDGFLEEPSHPEEPVRRRSQRSCAAKPIGFFNETQLAREAWSAACRS